MSIVAIIFSVLLVVSGIGLIVFVLLHSGKGTGVSDNDREVLFLRQPEWLKHHGKEPQPHYYYFGGCIPYLFDCAYGGIPAGYYRIVFI